MACIKGTVNSLGRQSTEVCGQAMTECQLNCTRKKKHEERAKGEDSKGTGTNCRDRMKEADPLLTALYIPPHQISLQNNAKKKYINRYNSVCYITSHSVHGGNMYSFFYT